MEFDEYVVDLNADCKCGCMDLHRFHKIYRFPNGYGASVVGNPKRPGFSGEGYRALVIRFTGEQTYVNADLPVFEANPVECGDWAQAAGVLQAIFDYRETREVFGGGGPRRPVTSRDGRCSSPCRS
ncbi:MAG: hypothetical protein Q4Q62_07735, partial [Thermoplasmata archaeon]|nr:hypothetical protein [Thermoplasmata archaeon]